MTASLRRAVSCLPNALPRSELNSRLDFQYRLFWAVVLDALQMSILQIVDVIHVSSSDMSAARAVRAVSSMVNR